MSLNNLISGSDWEVLKQFGLLDELSSIQKNQSDELDQKKSILELIDIKIKTLQNQLALDLKKTEILNPFKMTTIDSWSFHKTLKEMKDNGCESVIIELSSQGLQQNRHCGMGKLFIGGFLNIFPEHIESHGSFENYIAAKGIMFSLIKSKGFVIANKSNQLSEVLKKNSATTTPIIIKKGKDYSISPYSATMFKSFEYNGTKGESYFLADFEVENAIFGSQVVITYLQKFQSYSYNSDLIRRNYFSVPGRMEWVVKENQLVH